MGVRRRYDYQSVGANSTVDIVLGPLRVRERIEMVVFSAQTNGQDINHRFGMAADRQVNSVEWFGPAFQIDQAGLTNVFHFSLWHEVEEALRYYVHRIVNGSAMALTVFSSIGVRPAYLPSGAGGAPRIR